MGRNDSLQLSKSWQIRPNTYVHLTPAEDRRVWPSEAPLAPIPAPKTPAAQTISIPNLGLFPSSTPSSLEQSSLSNLTEFSFVQSGSKRMLARKPRRPGPDSRPTDFNENSHCVLGTDCAHSQPLTRYCKASSQHAHKVGTVSGPILQMRKLRHRSHRVCK